MLKSRKSFTESGVGIYEYVLVSKDATEDDIIREIKSVLLQYGASNKHLKIKPVVDIQNVCKYGTVYISEFDNLNSKEKMALINETSVKNITIRVFKTLDDEEMNIYKSRFKK